MAKKVDRKKSECKNIRDKMSACEKPYSENLTAIFPAAYSSMAYNHGQKFKGRFVGLQEN